MTRVALLLDVVGDRRGAAGNARHLVELAIGLQQLGHRVTIVCHDHDPGEGFAGVDLDIRSVTHGNAFDPSRKLEIGMRYLSGMRAMAALVPPDTEVINAFDWPALRAGSLAAGRLGVPLIWTRNDAGPWERALIPGRTSGGTSGLPFRFVYGGIGLRDLVDVHRASEIIVLSEFDRAMVRDAYRREARIIRIGCARQFFSPPDRVAARSRLGLSEGEYLIAAIALLVPHRHFEDLIDAVAALREDPDLRCRIVGSDHHDPAYANMLEARARTLGLEDRVRLVRRSISEADLRDLYAAADLYVFPSFRQSYGQAPLEALASGTPVAVSTGAGVHEVLVGRAGVQVFTPGDPSALAAAIRASRLSSRSAVAPTREFVRDTLNNTVYSEAISTLMAGLT